MEEFLKYDLSAKYFCSFGLTDKTPDHSYFGAFRARIGAHRLSVIFKSMVESLKKEGLIREFYSFVDASKMSHRARYRGEVKVYFQAVMEAFVHNVKRLATIRVQAIPIS